MIAFLIVTVFTAAAVVVAFWRGWRAGTEAGRRLGDAAHAACHRETLMAVDTILEAVDVAAWEEEL